MKTLKIEGVILREASPFDSGSPPDVCYATSLVDDIRQYQDRNLKIMVDSPGGDFLAACSISDATAAWLRHDGARTVSVEVGSMAFSAAAYFLASLPTARCTISLHQNSLLMFHGVTLDCVSGGAAALRDASSAADRCNAAIRDALYRRSTIPEDVIDQWLAEGRAGWLSAEEAIGFGLADEIIHQDAEDFVFSPKASIQNQENAIMNIDYLKTIVRNLKAIKNADPLQEPGQEPKKEPAPAAQEPQKAPEKEPAPAAQEPEKEPKKEPAPAAQEPEKAPEKEPAPAAQEPGQEEELSAIKEAVRVLQEAVAELQEKLLESMAKEAESSEVANRLTAGLRNRAGSSASAPAAATFQEALRKFRDEHPTMRYAEAYAAVARQNPSLYKAMLKA